MIHTITVCLDCRQQALAAQQHALRMGKFFGASVRLVHLWEGDEMQQVPDSATNPEEFTSGEIKQLIEQAREEGIVIEQSFRGEGYVKGILAEARECDLLVLAIVQDEEGGYPTIFSGALTDEPSIIRKAESSLLLVSEIPATLANVFVHYRGGLNGKAALRFAGTLAERAAANLTVLTVEGDGREGSFLASIAREYLRGFDIPELDTISRTAPESEIELIEEAEKAEADIIIVGEAQHGIISSLFGQDSAGRLAYATSLPVVIAR